GPRSNAILTAKARSGGRLARFFDSPPSPPSLPASLPWSACCANTTPRERAPGIAVSVASADGARKPSMEGGSAPSGPPIAPVPATTNAPTPIQILFVVLMALFRSPEQSARSLRADTAYINLEHQFVQSSRRL